MASASDAKRLKERRLTTTVSGEQRLPYFSGTDFSAENLKGENASSLKFSDVDFTDADLSGANFRGAVFQNCKFTGSNWKGTDFAGATFNGGELLGVLNCSKAISLHTVAASGFNSNFEKNDVPWYDKLDWEVIGAFGKLPLFAASSATLVLMPLYFYFIDLYNRQVLSLQKHAIVGDETNSTSSVFQGFANWHRISIPDMSLWALISALILLVASTLYALACPKNVKIFSLPVWLLQLQHSPVDYLGQAWRYRFIRLLCFSLYLIGGTIGLWVLGVKLFNTFVYVLRNS